MFCSFYENGFNQIIYVVVWEKVKEKVKDAAVHRGDSFYQYKTNNDMTMGQILT